MYKIKLLENNKIEDFISLYLESQKVINKVEGLGLISILGSEILRDDFMVFMLYRKGEPVGFTYGYKLDNYFYFASVYIKYKYRIRVKSLYDYSIKILKEKGYNLVASYGLTELGKNLAKKLGFKKENKIFYKEI